MPKRAESHPCVSDGLGLQSIGHEDGGPWKLVERKTEKFLAIVRFCPWCGAELSEKPSMCDGLTFDALKKAKRTIVSKRRRGNFKGKKNGKALLKLAEQIRKDGTFKKPVRRLGE
jgi:hypothetical protein